MISESLSLTIQQLPKEPGVYLMKDERNTIIYIGKANSLKKRVTSYFQKKHDDIKTKFLVNAIDSIECIVTDSEIEALLLESNLIKKHKPRFNIRLKDDKRYPYIAVTLKDDYPRVIYTRKPGIRGARYFGPYTDARAAKNIVDMINNTFKLKTCKKELPLKKHERPCLNYQMKKCQGPCMKETTGIEYMDIINNVISFLEGAIDPVISNLQKTMDQYSQKMEYEKASILRDIIFDIQTVTEEQKVSSASGIDRDFIVCSQEEAEAIVILFEFRQGILLGRKISVYDTGEISESGDILKTFILQYYQHSEVPQSIISDSTVNDNKLIQSHLTGLSSKNISISLAVSSEELSVVRLMHKNLDVIKADRNAAEVYQNKAKGLSELMEVLNLDSIPEVIECFDISNTQGTNAVASMVQFRHGEPSKGNYRRFKIRGHEGPNDPAMIHEAVSRRVQHLINENEPMPDLIVIDGGPTQLSRAKEAAENFTNSLVIVSLAKRFEEIYYDPTLTPIRLLETSPALHILQQIRDESHRFAITYHRKLRDKDTISSELDNINGIGHKTKVLLLKHFGSPEAVQKASLEDLLAVEGVGNKTATLIHNYFTEKLE